MVGFPRCSVRREAGPIFCFCKSFIFCIKGKIATVWCAAILISIVPLVLSYCTFCNDIFVAIRVYQVHLHTSVVSSWSGCCWESSSDVPLMLFQVFGHPCDWGWQRQEGERKDNERFTLTVEGSEFTTTVNLNYIQTPLDPLSGVSKPV